MWHERVPVAGRARAPARQPREDPPVPASKPPKLLLLSTGPIRGGAERVVLQLARQFTARDWEVSTVFPETPGAESLLSWARTHGVEAESSSRIKSVFSPRSVADSVALSRFVRSKRADIVNLHYSLSHISAKDVLAVRLARAGRLVVSVHLPFPWSELRPSARRGPCLAARLAHAVVANSLATRSVLLEAGVPANKIHLVPCGARPPAAWPNRHEARERLGLPADAFVVSLVARLSQEKGIDTLIGAVARLDQRDPAPWLVICGEGDQRASLEPIAEQRLGDRARFLGWLDDEMVDHVYEASDVFVLPSRMEGWPLTLMEAASHGVPSIGTPVGGVPELVLDGRTGLLVPPGDEADLASAIDRLRRDPELRRSLGRAARERADAEFSEQLMAARYARVFSA